MIDLDRLAQEIKRRSRAVLELYAPVAELDDVTAHEAWTGTEERVALDVARTQAIDAAHEAERFARIASALASRPRVRLERLFP